MTASLVGLLSQDFAVRVVFYLFFGCLVFASDIPYIIKNAFLFWGEKF
jgi:hypothetical protein